MRWHDLKALQERSREMMILLQLLRMLTHPWKKELNNYTTKRRRTSSYNNQRATAVLMRREKKEKIHKMHLIFLVLLSAAPALIEGSRGPTSADMGVGANADAAAAAATAATAVAAVENVIGRMLGIHFIASFNLNITSTTIGDNCPVAADGVGGCFELGTATDHNGTAVVDVRGTRVFRVQAAIVTVFLLLPSNICLNKYIYV